MKMTNLTSVERILEDQDTRAMIPTVIPPIATAIDQEQHPQDANVPVLAQVVKLLWLDLSCQTGDPDLS